MDKYCISMNINIYQKYKVNISGRYSYLSEENETMYDNIFRTEDYTRMLVISGGELLEMIIQNLEKPDISEYYIDSVNNDLHFRYFNPNNGEGGYEIFNIEVMPEVIYHQEVLANENN